MSARKYRFIWATGPTQTRRHVICMDGKKAIETCGVRGREWAPDASKIMPPCQRCLHKIALGLIPDPA